MRAKFNRGETLLKRAKMALLEGDARWGAYQTKKINVRIDLSIGVSPYWDWERGELAKVSPNTDFSRDRISSFTEAWGSRGEQKKRSTNE